MLSCIVLYAVPWLAFCISARIIVSDLLYDVVARVDFCSPARKRGLIMYELEIEIAVALGYVARTGQFS